VALATTQLDKGDSRKAEETLKKGIERSAPAILYQGTGACCCGETEAATRRSNLMPSNSSERRSLSMLVASHTISFWQARTARRERTARRLRNWRRRSSWIPRAARNHYALAQVYRRLGRAQDAARQVQVFQSLKSKEERTFSSVADGRARRASRKVATRERGSIRRGSIRDTKLTYRFSGPIFRLTMSREGYYNIIADRTFSIELC